MRARLPYLVEVRDRTSAGWEIIAAFNIESAARYYASECYENNKAYASYRVSHRGRKQPLVQQFDILPEVKSYHD